MESNLAMGWEVVTTMIEVVVTTMATVMALVVEMVVVKGSYERLEGG
jgi:hypothetical protein